MNNTQQLIGMESAFFVPLLVIGNRIHIKILFCSQQCEAVKWP